MILVNDHLIVERTGRNILVESEDSFAILSFHPLLAKRIREEFSDETTLGDVIYLTQSLGFEIETRKIDE